MKEERRSAVGLVASRPKIDVEAGISGKSVAMSIKRQLEECLELLKRGELTEERLSRVIDAIGENGSRRQDLLYLQAARTSVTS